MSQTEGIFGRMWGKRQEADSAKRGCPLPQESSLEERYVLKSNYGFLPRIAEEPVFRRNQQQRGWGLSEYPFVPRSTQPTALACQRHQLCARTNVGLHEEVADVEGHCPFAQTQLATDLTVSESLGHQQ